MQALSSDTDDTLSTLHNPSSKNKGATELYFTTAQYYKKETFAKMYTSL